MPEDQTVRTGREPSPWLMPVTTLPGIGPKRAQMLERLSIFTWFDLLLWLPRSYEDWANPVSIFELEDNTRASFVATVKTKPAVWRTGKVSLLRATLTADGYNIKAVWFNQNWLKNNLAVGRKYQFYGQIQRTGRTWQVQNPAFMAVGPQEDVAQREYKPVYGLTRGLNQALLRQLVKTAWQQQKDLLPEALPDWIRRDFQLATAAFAYERIHFPHNDQDIELSRRRIAFEELFLLRSGLYLVKQRLIQSARAWPLILTAEVEGKVRLFCEQLPFELTGAQKRVWQQIREDLGQNRPMNRLLQGDVGSGKTVVAALAMLHCALAGQQAALMAPTSILAEQHHKTLCRLLDKSGLEPVLITGATRESERRNIREGLLNGSIKLVVGTHALIQNSVVFQNLALTITDEQHRFGVGQRKQLSDTRNQSGDREPHVLVMSATPIPRTLALILYGDLDLSVIDELPPGRTPVKTYRAGEADRDRVLQLMDKIILKGEQIYVVCPLIEESADLDLESAVAVYNRLAGNPGKWRVGLLHGQLRQEQKSAQMERFLAGEIDILVSTTVIEVGVDNPKATCMIVENAERFGLAQLHQLRGRVGRSSRQSLCILMSDSKDPLARRRLQAICQSEDGFAIAEQDLALRGPGEFFGLRQHGLPDLRLLNLYRDRDLIAQVDQAFSQLIAQDPTLSQPHQQSLQAMIACRFPDVMARLAL